ncbi:uncharacterized protein METZ01_LOCUS396517, partial [marine metagenome]
MIDQEIHNLRAEQLNELRHGIHQNDLALVLLTGAEGIGKTSLLNALGGQLDSSEEPCLWVDLSKLKTEGDVLKYPQLLSHSMQTNTPHLKSKVEEAARELGREAFRLEAMATEAAAGTSENADPLPDLAETWGKILTEKLMSPQTDKDGNVSPAPRILILLEDFETFSKPQQLWVKEHLIDGLQTGNQTGPLAYIVTT